MKTVKRWSVFLFLVVLLMGLLSCASFPPIESIPSNTPDDVRSAILRLRSDFPVTRAEAAYTLGKMGSRASAAIPFLEYVSDDHASVLEKVWDTESKSETRVQTVSLQKYTTVGSVAREALSRIRIK